MSATAGIDEPGAGTAATDHEDGDPSPADGRFGAPIELPWWVPVAVLPPLLTLAGGVLLGAPPEARVTDIVVSAVMVYTVEQVGTRVQSRNMQSVYISAAYAFWCFLVLIWAVAAWPPHLLR